LLGENTEITEEAFIWPVNGQVELKIRRKKTRKKTFFFSSITPPSCLSFLRELIKLIEAHLSTLQNIKWIVLSSIILSLLKAQKTTIFFPRIFD